MEHFWNLNLKVAVTQKFFLTVWKLKERKAENQEGDSPVFLEKEKRVNTWTMYASEVEIHLENLQSFLSRYYITIGFKFEIFCLFHVSKSLLLSLPGYYRCWHAAAVAAADFGRIRRTVSYLKEILLKAEVLLVLWNMLYRICLA